MKIPFFTSYSWGRASTAIRSVILLPFVCTCLGATQQKPNVIFVMLDDLGYSQIEAFARGLSEEDCDPALLQHVREKGDYTPEDAFEMMRQASPTISRLADEGVMFTNAFACSNLCAPARMGIATGVLQNRWGMYRNIDVEAHGLKPNSHLAEQFQGNGYATAHIGKWHVGSRDRDMVGQALEAHGIKTDKEYTYWSIGQDYPKIKQELTLGGFEGSVVKKDHPLNNGFDYYFGYNQWECPFYNSTNLWEDFTPVGRVKEYNTDVFTQKAMNFMGQSMQLQQPFYLQLFYHAVHHPLDPKAPQKYYKRFDSGSRTLNNFYAHIYGVDENLRLILEFLAQHGQADNTLIVFTSDNGGAVGNASCLPGNAPYAGHKGMQLQGGFRVPLLFHWAGGIGKPLVKKQLVSTLDIIPTVLDAAGITVPSGLDGKSLLPQMLEDAEDDVHSYLVHAGIQARVWAFNGASSFFTHNVSREKAPSAYVVVDDRYILRFVADTMPNLYKDAVDGIPAFYALYDYQQDPLEQQNLYDSMPEKAQELISIWERESADFPKPVEWDVGKWEAIVNGQ
jgi:uncharacterized sulfatase